MSALLSCKPIIHYCNPNDFTYGNQWIVNCGNRLDLYFQIIDISQAQVNYNTYLSGTFFSSSTLFSGITPVGTTAGTRYLVGVDAYHQPYQVQVVFPSIDPNQFLTVNAVQVSTADSSIWKVTLAGSMTVSGGNVRFIVYQGNNIANFTVLNMLDTICPTTNGMC
jgi:hypothetical protein